MRQNGAASKREAPQLRSMPFAGSSRKPLPRTAIAVVNAYLHRGGRRGDLERRGPKLALRPYWNVFEAAYYAAPLAWAFAELLAKADFNRIRNCKNPECVLFFYDTSKSGTRTWCSLDMCGNKMLMAASRGRSRNE